MKEYSGKLISIFYRKSQIFWAQTLKAYDIASGEYPILIVLNRQDGITQDEIASELGIDKSAITRVVKSLLEKGFIERKKDLEDLRCNRIYLTEKGRESWEPIQKGREEWEAIMSKNLKKEETEEVIRILSQMVENIEEYFEED